MTDIDRPLPAASLSREEVARREVGQTTVGRATVRLLLAVFLTTVALVPLVEWIGLRTQEDAGLAPSWSGLIELPEEIRFQLAGGAEGTTDLWVRIVAANRHALGAFSEFELALEDESVLGAWLRPPAQLVMTRWLGAGNERVYKGRAGWLFYRPDVEYITSRGFLEPDVLRRRVAAASEWDAPPQPDPRPALLQFHRDLEALGIALIVVPTPLKPGVHPEKLARGAQGSDAVLQNASYDALVHDLRQQGVVLFDPAETLGPASRSGPQYLETDTHWTPEAMQAVAEQLAALVASRVGLPAVDDPGYEIEYLDVRNAGDTVRMLDLPPASTLYAPETVTVRRILGPDGSLWRSSRDADVLLLGDSFTNIYTLESMGWGTSAGLAEQVSYALGRPLDRLVQNDQGSFATREMLGRDPTRLQGKRVVIYQFAARELAFGDWRLLPLSGEAE